MEIRVYQGIGLNAGYSVSLIVFERELATNIPVENP